MQFTADRLGHELRNAMDACALTRKLRWRSCELADRELRKALECCLADHNWWERGLSGDYRLERLDQEMAL